MNNFKHLSSIVLLGVLTVGTAQAQTAANFPNKPVRFIAPFPPGGSTDTLARLVSLRLSEMWGQQVVVENRGGAGGTIGVELAARAAPDAIPNLQPTDSASCSNRRAACSQSASVCCSASVTPVSCRFT
ncbi:MAG: Bug family tripartite tricarboxylate transporter substrate binding protein, partial [Arenimonas sp.]|uniref:Bug family tripartite tricarboxylate transporter substrate binding protein n=1 Tax=Arenimonas sp. TaxID=1872635 RepID=UPI003C098142